MTRTIVLFTDSHSQCGVGQFNADLLRALAGNGDRVVCAQRREATPLQDELTGLGVEYRWSPVDPLKDPLTFASKGHFAAEVFREIEPDLVFFSNGMPMGSTAAIRTAAAMGLPYVTRDGSIETSFLPTAEPARGAVRDNYLEARAVVCNCRFHLDVLRRHLDLPETVGRIIPTAVAPPFFAPSDPARRADLRRDLEVPEDGILCITTARFQPIKGYDVLVKAIDRLKASPAWDRLRFVFLGDGPLRGEIEAAVEAIGAADRVHFPGHAWNVAEMLDAADIFILTSHFEGMSHSLVEAMAKGLAVVATRVGGIPEAMADHGRLVPPPTPADACTAAIAEAITHWTLDSEDRKRYGERARLRASVLFRADTAMDTFREVIMAAIGDR